MMTEIESDPLNTGLELVFLAKVCLLIKGYYKALFFWETALEQYALEQVQ